MATGQLGKQDYIQERQKPNGLKIEPFNEDIDLKLASYDITPTMIAMSSKIGMLETVYRGKDDPSLYIKVKAKDTVLVVSNEFFSVPANMAGYVVSRVSKVSDGFGHVSTSIDPNWNGALLIALSNPTNRSIKICVGRDRGPNTKGDSLATVSFHYLNTPGQEEPPDPDFKGMRLDLLDKKKYSERFGVKAMFRRVLYRRRRKFTDDFFKYVSDQRITLQSWPDISKTLSGHAMGDRPNIFEKYIVKESWIVRTVAWIRKHWKLICLILGLVLFILCVSGIISPEIKDNIVNGLTEFKKIRGLIPGA